MNYQQKPLVIPKLEITGRKLPRFTAWWYRLFDNIGFKMIWRF